VNFSDAQPSEFGESGLDAWKARLQNLFERFTAKLVVIVIEIPLANAQRPTPNCRGAAFSPNGRSSPRLM